MSKLVVDRQSRTVLRCDECSKSFSKRSEYNRHSKQHKKPHKCSACPRGFALRHDLDRHRAVHFALTTAKYRCSWPNCKFQGTTRRDYLWKHIREKHGKTSKDIEESEINNTVMELFKQCTEEQKLSTGRLSFMMAVQLGDIALVKNLLNNGADLEARNGEGQTPLHIATLNHNLEVIKVLFGAGINVEAKDNKRTAPIHYAADSGKELIVRLLVNRLLEMKSTVDIPDRQGATALYRAAANGHASIVSILLQVAADKSGRPGLRLTESTNSALKAAISGGYQEVVDVLLSAGCRPTHSELEKAVVGGNLDIVDALLNAGANVNKRPSRFNRTALQAAIEGRHEMIVARLLAAGARTDEEVWDGSYIMTPLHIAVRTSQRSVNIVKKLLAAGANVNEIGGNLQTPLQEATGLGDEEMIELLSAASAEANPGREISCAALLPGFETNGRGFFANYFLGACPDPAATETNSEKGNQL